MIKINLAPPDELENPLWWVMDVAVLVLIASLGYMGVQFYLNTVRTQITAIQAQDQSVNQEISSLEQDIKKYQEYETRLTTLNNTIKSIQGIAISRTTRYRQVIVMEHIQTLKPQGVWLSSMEICNDYSEFTGAAPSSACGRGNSAQSGGGARAGTNANANRKGTRVFLSGSGLDNILIAEFLTSLIATQSQDLDENDLRTQVVFNNVSLQISEKQDNTLGPNVHAYSFSIDMDVVDREVTPTPKQQLSWLLYPEKALYRSLASNFRAWR